MMKISNFQVFAEGDPGAGFLGLLIIFGVIWFCVQMNKPKGYRINHRGETTVKPIK